MYCPNQSKTVAMRQSLQLQKRDVDIYYILQGYDCDLQCYTRESSCIPNSNFENAEKLQELYVVMISQNRPVSEETLQIKFEQAGDIMQEIIDSSIDGQDKDCLTRTKDLYVEISLQIKSLMLMLIVVGIVGKYTINVTT